MELNELKALMAASIVGGSIAKHNGSARLDENTVLTLEIAAAVKISQQIWEETLAQDEEN